MPFLLKHIRHFVLTGWKSDESHSRKARKPIG